MAKPEGFWAQAMVETGMIAKMSTPVFTILADQARPIVIEAKLRDSIIICLQNKQNKNHLFSRAPLDPGVYLSPGHQ